MIDESMADLTVEDRNSIDLPTTRAAKYMVPGDVFECIVGTCVVMEGHKIPDPQGKHGHLLVRYREVNPETEEIDLRWDVVKCSGGACFKVVYRVPGSPAEPEGDCQGTSAGWKDPEHLCQALEDSP